MANCCFGWTNQVETGSLSVGSAASGLDASQLQNPIGSSAMAWQTAGPSVLAWGVPVVGRYCRVDITDTANPDGFLNIPLCYAGEVWIPARNFTWASSMGRASQSTRVVTRGGQVYVARLWSQRYWKLVLQGIKHTEIWPKLMELDAAARDGRNILFVPNPADADLQKSSVFGVLDPTSDLGYAFQSQDTRGWNATVTERL
jgi:hypothetical protein